MKYQPAKTIREFVRNFVYESNAIEGIFREPSDEEFYATDQFLDLDKVTIEDLEVFVLACQPEAVLRDKEGLNVYVGKYVPPAGGVIIKTRLEDILKDVNLQKDPWLMHKHYESLHPFTDGNGRSGRIIWLWQMLKTKKSLAPLGFMQSFYYQTLGASNG